MTGCLAKVMLCPAILSGKTELFVCIPDLITETVLFFAIVVLMLADFQQCNLQMPVIPNPGCSHQHQVLQVLVITCLQWLAICQAHEIL